ncbi:hypothetical protein [Parapedobacter tibetensis]|uniref:hypothetical protein n=1 Tax=Parapedobacter tibetensis TaxID=2972951 RepID=UPI00214D7A5A|nr:hypothetical protein [Parapedobacter tibetensis]
MANIVQLKILMVILLLLLCSACSLRKAERQRKANWVESFKQVVFMCGMKEFYTQPDTITKDVSLSINFDIIGNTHVNRLADSLGKAYASDLRANPYLMPVEGQPISNYFFGIYHSKILDSIAEAEYKKEKKYRKNLYKE